MSEGPDEGVKLAPNVIKKRIIAAIERKGGVISGRNTFKTLQHDVQCGSEKDKHGLVDVLLAMEAAGEIYVKREMKYIMEVGIPASMVSAASESGAQILEVMPETVREYRAELSTAAGRQSDEALGGSEEGLVEATDPNEVIVQLTGIIEQLEAMLLERDETIVTLDRKAAECEDKIVTLEAARSAAAELLEVAEGETALVKEELTAVQAKLTVAEEESARLRREVDAKAQVSAKAVAVIERYKK